MANKKWDIAADSMFDLATLVGWKAMDYKAGLDACKRSLDAAQRIPDPARIAKAARSCLYFSAELGLFRETHALFDTFVRFRSRYNATRTIADAFVDDAEAHLWYSESLLCLFLDSHDPALLSKLLAVTSSALTASQTIKTASSNRRPVFSVDQMRKNSLVNFEILLLRYVALRLLDPKDPMVRTTLDSVKTLIEQGT